MTMTQRFRPGASLTALLFTAFTLTAKADISPDAVALAKAVAAILAPAKTIQLTATHKMDAVLGTRTKLDAGPLNITVKRPNKCYVLQSAGKDTRVLSYDGEMLCLLNPFLKFHALEQLKAGSIKQFSDAMEERFGFRPPVAELLAADLPKQLFANATSATVAGKEWVGWTRCDRLHIEQEGMTGDLWVGAKDKLPRRLLLTFTGIEGHPKWDIRLSKWEFDGQVDESLFTKRPAADSSRAPMVKGR